MTPTTVSNKLHEALDLFALLIASKLLTAKKTRKGRKLDMRCRAKGCRKRSKGPRFHFLCTRHLKSKHLRIAA